MQEGSLPFPRDRQYNSLMREISDIIGTVEAARILGCDRSTVGLLIQRGELAAMQVANHWVLERRQVEQFARTYRPLRGRPGHRVQAAKSMSSKKRGKREKRT